MLGLRIFFCKHFNLISDLDPSLLYADPDRQNLMNADPDPGY